jgi:hypothetical protein
MSPTTQKFWPSVAPGKKLSPAQLLEGLETKLDQLGKRYQANPSKNLELQILQLAQRIAAHRTTQGLDVKDLLPRLKSLLSPPSQLASVTKN